MITLNLSPETQAVLEKQAAANNRSIEEQAELTLAKYASGQYVDTVGLSEYEGIYKPEPQELAELLETIAEYEAHKATGLRITHDDIKQRVADRLVQHKLQTELIDWENWAAEEIIANIRASRYDRPRYLDAL